MAEDIPLPEYLTRQYDYAGGFRRLGDAWNRGKEMGLRREALQQQVNHDQIILQKAKEDAAMRLRQSIGIANYKQDFESLMKNGKLTEAQASSRALAKHAADIFGGTASLQNFVDDATKREYEAKFQEALNTHRDNLFDLKKQQSETDAAFKAAGAETSALKILLEANKQNTDTQLKIIQSQIHRPQSPTGKAYSDLRAAEEAGDVEQAKTLRKAIEEGGVEKEPVVERMIQKQLDDLESLETSAGKPAWTPEEKIRRRAELRAQKEFRPGMRGHIQLGPDGQMIADFGEGIPTVGTQTAIQTDLARLQNSVTQIDNAANNLTEKDLGVAGAVWDSFVNKWVAQVIPELADPSVSSNRTQVQKAVDSYLQTQEARGRMSAAERADAREALVTRKLGESLPRAKSVLKTMVKVQKIESISKAKAGQQPLQPWMFKGMSSQDITRLFKEGTLTEDEAMKWLTTNR